SAGAWVSRVDDHGYVRHRAGGPRLWVVLGGVSGLSVLGMGCGGGRCSRQVAERGAAGTGCGYSRALVEVAFDRGGGPGYLQGNAEALPFRSETFDLAVSYVMLLDVPDYQACIRETMRVLKPGGRLLYLNLQPYCTPSNSGCVRALEGD